MFDLLFSLTVSGKKSKKAEDPPEPTLTFDELPKKIDHPLMVRKVWKCFDAAVADKLQHWVVEGASDSKNKGQLLTQQCEELHDHEFIRSLGWQAVVKTATDAAEALEKFKVDSRNWTVGTKLDGPKEKFAALAKEYDCSYQQLVNFEDTVDSCKKECDDEAKLAKEERSKLRTRTYIALGRHGVPQVLAKVELLFSAFRFFEIIS